MANTKFPLTLNGVRFQVNPMNLSIEKPIVKGDLATQGGIRYQIWYDHPEQLTIEGMSAGETAYSELLFLKQQYERTNTLRHSELFYKSTVYRGFIETMTIGHGVDAHLRFPYSITFQLLAGEQFKVEDFALEPRGLLGEFQGILEETINVPIAGAERALGQAFGRVI